MFVYCLFCATEKCGSVARAAEARFHCRALSPKQVQHTWSKGKMIDRENDLLPGYVFLYYEEKVENPVVLRSVDGVIRCLKDTSGQYELTGMDEQFALMLLSKNGIIGKTSVYQEGQRIHVCKGAFEGLETKILKVNRRNSRILIEIPFAMRPVKTWVEYELVEASEKDSRFG